jgi:hypothetical protein
MVRSVGYGGALRSRSYSARHSGCTIVSYPTTARRNREEFRLFYRRCYFELLGGLLSDSCSSRGRAASQVARLGRLVVHHGTNRMLVSGGALG